MNNEELNKAIEEAALSAFKDASQYKDLYDLLQEAKRYGFKAGAHTALADESIYSKAGLRKDEWRDFHIGYPIGRVLLLTSSTHIYIGDRYQNKWRVCGLWRHDGDKWISDLKDEDVIKWQPLPAPPKQ